MAKRKIRARIRRSHLYTFCLKPQVSQGEIEPSLPEGPGFSRIVHCNQPDIHRTKPFLYRANNISTTKYSLVTFVPKGLFEQFRRAANIYFLLAAILSVTSVSPFGCVSMIAPLAIVVGLTMAKEGVEDWARFTQDNEINHRKVSVHRGEGVFNEVTWQDVVVGDIVKVKKDGFFPADLLLLSSGYEDGICYVETMNLDGETNLKIKRAPEVTLTLDDDESFKNFQGTIKCEDPNPSLYTFVGNLEYDSQVYPIDPTQVLLRDSKLRNTTYIYGAVIFTGHDSKVMQNSTESPSKRSRIEKKMDQVIYILFSVLILISLISSIGFGARTKFEMPNWWYLRAPDAEGLYDPNNAAVSGVFHLVTALILYGYLIPISLYVSIEFVKFLQAAFIDRDINMYHEESGTPARARTSNLNEELGQVDTILSDKTGTLTCNQMDFLKCSIAGVAYGTRPSEVELATVKQMAADLEGKDSDLPSFGGAKKLEIELETVITAKDEKDHKHPIKFFGFEDSRLLNGNWVNEPNVDVLLLYFRILAVCQSAIPEQIEETGLYTYEAESPDENAFLAAAREFGFEFVRRTQSTVIILERYPNYSQPVEREYKILTLLEFTSKRKRMSVIVRDEDGDILLLCKGADSIIFDRLAKHGKQYLEVTTGHINEYGENGLRTLALAYKKLEESEFDAWNNEFQKAKSTIGSDRDANLERVSELMEKDLILIGATAIEDKLQQGVPECIDKLAHAGLKLWVLTGDKMETAINIGFSCSLLRQGMKQICISTAVFEEAGNDSKEAIKENVLKQITNATEMINFEKDPNAAFALIIDGKGLTYALDNDMKLQFLNLAIKCASVICCRVSPKQKALVTRLVKEGTGKTTLAIGDGANDVGMIQEADIGVGISGCEGMQAVMASDFAVAQFRFLERLLLVHGHWCYKRISHMICYFFYKNIVFGLTLFYFEGLAAFSGQTIYDDWYSLSFNVILTSLPVISLGVFEQDVSSDVCFEFPALYQQGPRNLFFDWARIFGWMANGLYTSLVVFFLTIYIFENTAFRPEGKVADMYVMGTIMFSCIIWVVNCQITLTMSHFTWIQHVLVWGSIAMWYIFIVIYGSLPVEISGNAYQQFVEILAPATIYWTTTLLVTVLSVGPYFIHLAVQRALNPLDHQVIQEIKYYKKDVEDQIMWHRERSKARTKTNYGFTARVEAKMRQLKMKYHKKQSGTVAAFPSPAHLSSSLENEI